MIINQYNPLRECILGAVDLRLIDSINPNPAMRRKLEHIFKQTSVDFDNIQRTLESRGIVVHRPTLIVPDTFRTPYRTIPGGKLPLAPRDFFLLVDEDIVETVNWQPEAQFMSYNYREIMLDYFAKGSYWYSMPMPRHDPAGDIGEELANIDPIFDAPCAVPHNNMMFISTHGAVNPLGEQWIRRMFSHKNIIGMDPAHFSGHLDSHFAILRDGLVLTHHPREHFPEYFNDWDFINVDPRTNSGQTLVDERLQDDDFDNTVLAVNMLSLDPNTVLLNSHYKTYDYMLSQLQKHNIETVFVDFEYMNFFNNGITCIILDTVRDV